MVGQFCNEDGDAYSKRHVDEGHEVHGQPTFGKGAEEARTHLQSHGCDKENKAKLFDDMKHLGVEAYAQGAECNAYKEDPGDAEGYAFNLYFAEQEP